MLAPRILRECLSLSSKKKISMGKVTLEEVVLFIADNVFASQLWQAHLTDAHQVIYHFLGPLSKPRPGSRDLSDFSPCQHLKKLLYALINLAYLVQVSLFR